MIIFLTVLILIISVLLGLVVLIQNPKGGGLSGTFGGFGTQVIGAGRTTDVMEKTTWTLAILIGLLCLFSAFFIPRPSATGNQQPSAVEKAIQTMPVTPSAPTSAPAPAPTTPSGNTPGGK
ncbi:preprotein translocase subunit SecG [Thermoflavifilum thermophilum]|uniref:Protein-export membrane protein SecG n=1 Tax=Thermoflavifilum thermophilum TaxID=1393122 RepID=A0A1I7N033_9BACT|nr:preprotein translocase subunit SecG [Thermoflavifilum thermophilum]SFV27988.1 preprotein translocase subunit SecG [Thermoflavifilum thermophilum]